ELLSVEMRARRKRRADSVNDRETFRVVERLQRRQLRMEPEVAVQVDQRLAPLASRTRKGHCRAQLVVLRIPVGRAKAQAVGAASQEGEDQDVARALRRLGRPRQERSRTGCGSEGCPPHTFQETPAREIPHRRHLIWKSGLASASPATRCSRARCTEPTRVDIERRARSESIPETDRLECGVALLFATPGNVPAPSWSARSNRAIWEAPFSQSAPRFEYPVGGLQP